MQRVFLLSLITLVGATLTTGCLKEPDVGKAAAPSQAKSGGVMGSATTNNEVNRKVEALTKLLDGKVDVDGALKELDIAYKDLTEKEKQERLASLKDALDSLKGGVGKGRAMPAGPERDMVVARLYFGEHRFIESAMLLSTVLDVKEDFPGARNLLARCFYFLGNRDRTIQELEYILRHPTQSQVPQERLDALFLLGAAVAESDAPDKETLAKGIWSWETYLKELPESDRKATLLEGLERMRAQERGEQPAPGGPGAAPGKAGDRLATLPADASDLDKARAAGLDALDAKDFPTAEAKLREAIAASPNDAPTLVGLGRIFVQTGRIPDALSTFKKAIAADIAYMPAYHYNGMANMMNNDAKGAVENWEHIMKTDPDYAKRFQLNQRLEVARRMAGG